MEQEYKTNVEKSPMSIVIPFISPFKVDVLNVDLKLPQFLTEYLIKFWNI